VTDVDQARCTAAIAEEFAAIDELLASLAPEDWSVPTACPGWDVKANAAHVIGTEAMLLGEPTPEVDVDVAGRAHVRNDIGGFNEAWVVHLAEASPAEILAEYRPRVAARLEQLAAVDPEAWSTEGFTPAGKDTHGRFMRIRVMDCWMHEQDIREAVGRPGHESGPVVELVLDELQQSMGYVVGKKAGAPEGASVTFALGSRDIHVLVDGRAAVVGSLPGPATATLTMTPLLFTRLAGGRTGADTSAVAITGDADLGRRVVENMGFTI
jgi:uncharacterized protein (TIGR03083 family)